MNLNDVCYEQINDNFHYGKFGEFILVIDKNTGCFNATKMCKDGEKRFRDWSRLERAQQLISFYENKSRRADLRVGFYEVKGDNKHILSSKITGQYVQKEFILDIASWISPEFYFKCSNIVNDYFIGQYKKELEEKTKQLDEANEKALNLQALAISNTQLDQTQIIYIATSESYAKQNRFKVGGVQALKLLKSRLSTYNSRSAVGDFFYYAAIFTVYDYKQIEERLKSLLTRFRDKKTKEIYIMHYPDIHYVVKYICDHLAEEVDEVNQKLEMFITNYTKRGTAAVVPPAVEDWKQEQQDEVIYEEDVGDLRPDAIEVLEEFGKLKSSLTKLLMELPQTQKEISKREIFDELKVRKNRNEKLPILKETIREIRPDMVLRDKRVTRSSVK